MHHANAASSANGVKLTNSGRDLDIDLPVAKDIGGKGQIGAVDQIVNTPDKRLGVQFIP